MKNIRLVTIIVVLNILVMCCAHASTPVRIRDVARVRGIRDNQLTGYGVVVGLDGSGDGNSPALRSIINRMKTYGLDMDPNEISVDNAAAVFITATLPPYASEGDRIDITVATMSDADDLSGGILLQAPLFAANGNVYAVAAGPVSVAGAGAAGARGNHLTTGRIPDGAIVEVGVDGDFSIIHDGQFSLMISEKSFANSSRMARAINDRFGYGRAKAVNPGEVQVKLPVSFANNPVEFIALVQEVQFDAETNARVIINERTGTVIMGADTRISPVSISHGDISLRITAMNDHVMTGTNDQNNQINGQNDMTNGQNDQFNGQNNDVNGQADALGVADGGVKTVPGSTNVSDVVQALNVMGATSQDIIAIFQALKSAGALHADLSLI